MAQPRRFGRRLRYLRQQLGLSQEQVAERLGVSSETISNLERGVHAPVFDRLEALAIALEVAPQALFLDGPEQEAPD